MLKNLSDYLSFFTLIFFLIESLRILIWAFTNEDVSDTISRWEVYADYLNNEEE